MWDQISFKCGIASGQRNVNWPIHLHMKWIINLPEMGKKSKIFLNFVRCSSDYKELNQAILTMSKAMNFQFWITEHSFNWLFQSTPCCETFDNKITMCRSLVDRSFQIILHRNCNFFLHRQKNHYLQMHFGYCKMELGNFSNFMKAKPYFSSFK